MKQQHSPNQPLPSSEPLVLTPNERAAGRFALQARMAVALTPQEKTDIRRTLQHALYLDPAPARWSWFRLPAVAFAVVLLLGASSGGLAYAAEYAVPGDVLFGFKLHVNEAIAAGLRRSAEEKAQWSVILLERRMAELRRLEERGLAQDAIEQRVADTLEKTALVVEQSVDALPAAAAERAAARTAVRAAIGSDDDDLRRAARITQVLKALRERAEQFEDDPLPDTIQPIPSATVKVETNIDAHVTSTIRNESTNGETTTDSHAAVHVQNGDVTVEASTANDDVIVVPSGTVQVEQSTTVDASDVHEAVEEAIDRATEGLSDDLQETLDNLNVGF